MVRRWLVASLLLLALAAPAAGAEVLPFRFPAGSDSVSSVNATTQAADTLRFSFRESDLNLTGLRGATVHLATAGEGLDVSLVADAAPSGQRTWSGDLKVSTPDLVHGEWNATLLVVHSDGTQSQPVPGRPLFVNATDNAAPTITFPGKEGSIVRIGAFDDVIAIVEDPLLRSVTFRLPGMVAGLPLPAPYHLTASTFAEGPQDLVLTAVDRAGRASHANVTVILDRSPPTMVAIAPPRIFLGVPAVVNVYVDDASPYVVSLTLDDANATTMSASGAGGSRVHSFTLPTLALGNHTFSVAVRDAVSNVRDSLVSASVEVPETDSTITFAEFLQPRPIIGEALVLRVTLEQVRGVTSLPLTLRYAGAAQGAENATVPGPGSKVVDIPFTLPVGQHIVTLSVAAPPEALELDDSNQNRTLTIEVFFGRVQDGTIDYAIRASPLGLPGLAVNANGTTYPMTLVESTGSSVYEFTVEGNRTLTWDPRNPDSTTASSNSSSSSGTPGEDTPMPAFPLVALALAALAFARRRKL